jgi:hypothetical protein
MLSIQSGADEMTVKDWSSSQRRNPREYHVHSHLFQNLDADSRYEVIIQSKNKFGWSEPTKSFIFSTRLRGGLNFKINFDLFQIKTKMTSLYYY